MSGIKTAVRELSNGVYIPIIGLGTYLAQGTDAADAMVTALKHGYKLIDTAEIYHNYPAVKLALEQYEKDSSSHPQKCSATQNIVLPPHTKTIDGAGWLENLKVPHGEKCREDQHTVFVTTKAWPHYSKESIQEAVTKFRHGCGRSQIDLLLLHWPALLKEAGATEEQMKDLVGNERMRLEAWHEMERQYAAGMVRAIGVSNFMVQHLDPLIADVKKRQNEGDSIAVMPMLNQIEISPWLLPPPALLKLCAANDIVLQAYSPLGSQKRVSETLSNPLLQSMSEKYHKPTANVMLRSLLDHGFIAIPKSVRAERIVSNYDVFDFHMDEPDQQKLVSELNKGIRACPDPNLIS
eukprot:Protomagalhaensia_sp_Gyna_25__1971@NODE_2051_length_1323_cov_1747_697040_g1693_i0_p1_GENE_NODE_2051_length_1323_cov_1747_697040_g1693_i0NODE_2051_length_1323_cov_1747_697040_g1693_i0_p1_ORF_typecomplete_len351_score46_10Aldo_ket_red/PF00248_21/9_5e05Aldo_ket_red/PF00248_21/3_3e36_NODE_2051_length_1323_cov_1747_697040_g1693_i0741126